MQQTFYTTSELAKALKVTPRTVQNWRDRGLIDFIKIRNKILYTREQLDDFLRRHAIIAFNS